MTEKLCPPVSCPPEIGVCLSNLFGNPQGAHGRGDATVQGIVLHCLHESQTSYEQRTKGKETGGGDHAALHFTVGDCGITQYVDTCDVAWAHSTYAGNFPQPLEPPYTYAGWPDLPTDYPLDYQVIHVGITVQPPANTDYCPDCETYGLGEVGYRNLVHLLAYLVQENCLVLGSHTVQFHEWVEDLGECPDEACLCNDIHKLLCDIAEWCEDCEPDSRYMVDGDIAYFHGVNSYGCPVRLPADALLDAIFCRVEKMICDEIEKHLYDGCHELTAGSEE